MLYPTKLTITALTLPDSFGGELIQWVLSRSADEISKLIFYFTISILKESVSSPFTSGTSWINIDFNIFNFAPFYQLHFAAYTKFLTLVDKEKPFL